MNYFLNHNKRPQSTNQMYISRTALDVRILPHGDIETLPAFMMTSSNGNIFRVTGHLCAGKSPVSGEFPTQRPVTRSFDVFFDLCLHKRLSKQSCGWWFETPASSLWRHCNVTALREWNHWSPVDYPHKSPEMRSFSVALVVSVNKLLKKPVASEFRHAHVTSLWQHDLKIS